MKKLPSPITILGFGNEGQYAYEFLKKRGYDDLTICDENEAVELPEDVKKKIGVAAFEDLTEFKTIIRSPGIHYNLPGIVAAKDAGCLVTSMTEITLEIGRERMTAITGSNGKTTTTGMLDAILTAHYENEIIMGGNDRNPVLEAALEHSDWPILMEVSSFQFADLQMSPHIAGVLNIKPNHMDWHENMEDYVHAKRNIMMHQNASDWAILNANDENSAKLAEHAKGKVFWVGKKKGENWVNWEKSPENITPESEVPQPRLLAKYKGNITEILSASDLRVKTHPDNIAFAAAGALLHGVKAGLIKKALMEFKGMPYRIEFIREIDGIKFYNDSACTTPESAQVCLEQFPKGQLILLMGGSSKSADFSFLAHHLVENTVRVYLYGEEGQHIKKALIAEGGEGLILRLDDSKDFISIINNAYQQSDVGDNIVLSPACASFDMFKNSKQRGKMFTEIVESL